MVNIVLLASICACGVAPERENDFYWENDKFGMRAYGPGNTHVWTGLDVFNKAAGAESSCGYVLNNHDKCGNWHIKPYKGILDNYTMGASRGVGGVALFADGEWKTYSTWEKCEIVTNSDEKCEFRLVYPAFSALGKMTYHITLKKGERFFRNDVSFEFPKRIRDFKVGPGLDLEPKRDHKGDVWEDRELGVVSIFEDAKNKSEGSTMAAVIVPRKAWDMPGDATEFLTDMQNCRVIAMRKPSFTYYAGAAWSKSREIETAEAWRKTVREFAERINK